MVTYLLLWIVCVNVLKFTYIRMVTILPTKVAVLFNFHLILINFSFAGPMYVNSKNNAEVDGVHTNDENIRKVKEQKRTSQRERKQETNYNNGSYKH